MELDNKSVRYRSALLDQYRNITKGVLHLGAHKGQERDAYQSLSLKVLWVEANPEVFNNLKLNIFSYANQEAFCALLADVNGKQIDFNISNNSDGVSSSIFDFGEYAKGSESLWPNLNLDMVNKITLTSTTIDSLFEANNVNGEDYDFWLLDLQGAELLALNGAKTSLEFCKYLYVEVSTVEVYQGGVSWEELNSFLTEIGFIALWNPEIEHDDILFVRKNIIDEHLRVFNSDFYQRHNSRRLEHLASLQLDLMNKSVLEIAAGVGDHTSFYQDRGCDITVTDVRPENLKYMKNRFQKDGNIKVQFFDIDNPVEFEEYFDLVHCYGALYHSSNPEKLIEYLSKTGQTLLMETCVTPEGKDTFLVNEHSFDPSQAFYGKGCRPGRSWLWEVLSKNFEFVYTTRTQPVHEEFPVLWSDIKVSKSNLTRGVFIASHTAINNHNLIPALIERHQTY